MDLADKIVEAAMAWWRGRRPLEYSLRQHLSNPTINTMNDSERKLARACGELAELKQQKAKDRRTEKKINRRAVRGTYFLNEQHTTHVTKSQARKERRAARKS